MLGMLAARIAARHPAMFARLGPHACKTFGIVPVDLPLAFVLKPQPGRIRLAVVRAIEGTKADACISGPLLSLVALVEGRADGDALFFSRDLTIEGDVEAVLALRNAVDDAGLDIAAELTAPLGALAIPMGDLIRMAARRIGARSAAQTPPAASWS
jgi:predicted lipid carrier protein YhbT